MSRRALQLVASVLAIAAVAAATGPTGAWLDVPFIAQEKNGCGAAVLGMVMQYWEQQQKTTSPSGRADPRAIQKALYSQPDRGISATAMERYLRENGFRAFSFAGEWRDLEQHLGKGRPVIVAVRPGRRAQEHYVVVAGLDSERSLVFVNDPARGKLLRVARAQFEREWNAAGNWALLALPSQIE